MFKNDCHRPELDISLSEKVKELTLEEGIGAVGPTFNVRRNKKTRRFQYSKVF